MAYEDSSPERRNLVVTSLAFIVFTAAGGEFKDSIVQLEVINASFSRPGVLAVFAWSALFWFIYRYWLVHPGQVGANFRGDIQSYAQHRLLQRYASKKLNGREISDNEEGYRLHVIRWERGDIYGQCVAAKRVVRDAKGKLQSWTPIDGKNPIEICFSGPVAWAAVAPVLVRWAFEKQAFSNFVVPYILAAAAIYCGAYRVVF